MKKLLAILLAMLVLGGVFAVGASAATVSDCYAAINTDKDWYWHVHEAAVRKNLWNNVPDIFNERQFATPAGIDGYEDWRDWYESYKTTGPVSGFKKDNPHWTLEDATNAERDTYLAWINGSIQGSKDAVEALKKNSIVLTQKQWDKRTGIYEAVEAHLKQIRSGSGYDVVRYSTAEIKYEMEYAKEIYKNDPTALANMAKSRTTEGSTTIGNLHRDYYLAVWMNKDSNSAATLKSGLIAAFDKLYYGGNPPTTKPPTTTKPPVTTTKPSTTTTKAPVTTTKAPTTTTQPPITTQPVKTVGNTSYISNFWNWFMYIVFFGFIWMK